LIVLPKKITNVAVCTTYVNSYICLFISRNHLLQQYLILEFFLAIVTENVFFACLFLESSKCQTRATQMADCGPNPDLWMVTAGPRQPLKGVLYIQKFLSKNVALLAVLLKHNSSPTALSDCRSSC